MTCELLETCAFYNNRMRELPKLTDHLKQQYCRGEWEKCARLKIARALGKSRVPNDLYPPQLLRADRLIKGGRR